MGACCTSSSEKNRKKELGKSDLDKKPLRTDNGIRKYSDDDGEFSMDESVSYSDNSLNPSSHRDSRDSRGGAGDARDKSKTIVTDFGFAIGIELDDIATFLDDIRNTDKKREKNRNSDSNDNNNNNKKRKMDGMDRIWYGCVGSSTKTKEEIEEISTPSQLNRLLYKLTYVTLNTFHKSKKLNKSSIKAKPDKKAVEQALIPVKRAILLLKYNKPVKRGDPELNKNVILTREEFKKSFPQYLRQASQFMQQKENGRK